MVLVLDVLRSLHAAIKRVLRVPNGDDVSVVRDKN